MVVLLVVVCGYYCCEDKLFWWVYFDWFNYFVDEWLDSMDVFFVSEVLVIVDWYMLFCVCKL